MPVRRWSYPGNRARREGPQAVPLPRAFSRERESTKYEHVVAFADTLPAIREKVREDMALRGPPREKVLGTVVHLLETTLIRVGNVRRIGIRTTTIPRRDTRSQRSKLLADCRGQEPPVCGPLDAAAGDKR